MTMPSTHPLRNGGFTLVELVITIIVIGILSAVVLPSMNTLAQHSVTLQADELRRNLSHAQLISISQGQRLRLNVNAAGTNYTVTSCSDATCTTPAAVTDPATGANFSIDLKDGVTFSSGANSNLDLDSLGRPQLAGTLIAAPLTYTLSGSGRNVSVSVLPITGFAETFY